jgi:hypothetical protein
MFLEAPIAKTSIVDSYSVSCGMLDVVLFRMSQGLGLYRSLRLRPAFTADV